MSELLAAMSIVKLYARFFQGVSLTIISLNTNHMMSICLDHGLREDPLSHVPRAQAGSAGLEGVLAALVRRHTAMQLWQ